VAVALFVVPHTHWDREWYEPAERFRQRLVAALDRALELLDDGRLPVFLLDGQTVLVLDYLAVRSGREGDIRRLADAGKLLLGPWYVLADELMASDETLVRNLQIGKREAGAGWLRLGYSPDAFGHPAGMPTILAGFGIEYGILWRGYGGQPGQDRDLFHWHGPDGARVLVHHLPPAGYELGANLPSDRSWAKRRWEEIRAVLEPRAAGRPLLLLNGADHHAPQEDFPEALDALEGVSAYRVPRTAHPLDYFAALPSALDVPRVEGELRFSYRSCRTLQGTFAVRASLKRVIREGERLLTRWAEPQVALVAGDPEHRLALLEAGWRTHLENCFHDTLCGTTSDAVARAAAVRAASVTDQARGLLDDALHGRLGQDRSHARRHEGEWVPTLAIVNPSAHDRSGVVEATILVTEGRVRVGAATGPSPSTQRPAPKPPVVRRTDGTQVPLQVLGSYAAYDRLDAPDGYPLQDRVRAWRVALWVDDVPALGVKTYRVESGRAGEREGGTEARRHGGTEAQRHRSTETGAVHVRANELVNERWTVRAGGRGFRLETNRDRTVLDDVADVRSERDDGDLYTFEPVLDEPPIRARWQKPRVVGSGPLIGAIARSFDVHGRARGAVYARLDAGSNLVRLVAEGENLAGGHRLRIRFPLPASPGRSSAQRPAPRAHFADQHYGPVTRVREEIDVAHFPDEWPVHTAPMQRYVTVPGGITLLSRDCFEYEVTDDGAVVVTLFRAVDQLSKDDLRARPGHVAWPMATPDARLLGRFRAEFALTLETPTVDELAAPGRLRPPVAARGWVGVERAAEEFHAPLAGRMLRYAIEPPQRVQGPRLEGDGLVFKAVTAKAGEEGEREVVLRCVNLEAARARGTWIMPFDVARAWKARLDETRLEELTVSAGRRQLRFEAGPREVVTVIVAL
jgi:mannosylglycerate hydrolase